MNEVLHGRENLMETGEEILIHTIYIRLESFWETQSYKTINK